MCRYFSGLIQHDHIADRQAVAMIIHGLSTVEFLIQLLQQFRLRNAALSGRKIATVENLVIINPFLADSPMRSSKMLYRLFASVFSQLAREIIGHFASVENAQILKQYIVLPKAAAKDEIFFGFTWHFCLFSDFSVYFYDIPRFKRLGSRASAGAAALPSTLLRSSMTARLQTCSC